ncbi:MAG: hypothetical protein IKC48_03320, partial [Clostridia bacterium]|nr:hypothetical protein [Clostridia bacterium]
MTIKKEKVLEWVKRIIVYFVGLFIIAFGVAVAKMSNLGVSSATSFPYVLSLKFTALTIGNWTTIVYCVMVLLQLALLGKEFKWYYIFQFAVSTVFGFFVDLAVLLCDLIVPAVNHYALQMLYTAISLVLIAIGVILYLAPNIMSMPVEGFAQALAKRTKLQFSTTKMISDLSLTALAVIFSLIFWGKLEGVREGTIILAFGTGFVIRPLNKLIKQPLHNFLFGKKDEPIEQKMDKTDAELNQKTDEINIEIEQKMQATTDTV